jgi:hypothetical protein
VSAKSAAHRLEKLLHTAEKKLALRDHALKAAASASIALAQNSGEGFPVDSIKKRVATVLEELAEEERTRLEHEAGEKTSTLAKIAAHLKYESASAVASLRKGMESALAAYCVARGSSPEWRTMRSGPMKSAGGSGVMKRPDS